MVDHHHVDSPVRRRGVQVLVVGDVELVVVAVRWAAAVAPSVVAVAVDGRGVGVDPDAAVLVVLWHRAKFPQTRNVPGVTVSKSRSGARPTYGHRWRQMRDRVRRTQSICWICGGPINFDAKYPASDSFTVDHVEPVSLRPELALELSNLRAAHAGCNVRRGVGRRVKGGRPSRAW